MAFLVKKLRTERDTYRHAFETTAADRDLWKARAERRHTALAWALDHIPDPALPPMTGPYPHLVCVGAQKCATSFLYSAIRDHPLVEVAPKDTGSLTADAPVAFEAGLIEHGTETVAALNPAARILICVRDPHARAVSEYRMRVREGVETRPIKDAFAADEQAGPRAYLRRSRFDLDIPRWKEAFADVLVLSADDDSRLNLWRLFLFMGIRDADALAIAGSPPWEYAGASSAAAQAAELTPEQARLHQAAS